MNTLRDKVSSARARPNPGARATVARVDQEGFIVMSTWFTSDTHFGHENTIRFCGRPFASAGEMNHVLTQRWNEIVAPDDVVYHLGDFAMGDPETWADYRLALNGRIILVLGNHDCNPEAMLHDGGFDQVETNVVVEVEGVALWLNHYPIATLDDMPKHRLRPPAPGDYDVAFCGHIHQRWRKRAGCVNVGVDVWGFRPISLAKILASNELDTVVAASAASR